MYRGFGGGERGLSFKELLCGLVLIVHGTKEEKAKCENTLYIAHTGACVTVE